MTIINRDLLKKILAGLGFEPTILPRLAQQYLHRRDLCHSN